MGGGDAPMTLTGELFLALLLTATAIGFALVVHLMPRLAATGVRTVAARVGLLAGINALVLLTAATLINDQYHLFADWTDLAGAVDPGGAYSTAREGAPAGQAAATRLRGAFPLTAPTVPLTTPRAATEQNRVLTYTITGAVSHVTAQVMVELPAGYTLPTQRHRTYPVLEAFHGYPGTPAQWIESMGLGEVLQAEARQHRIGPALIVAPQIELPPGRDTECVDPSSDRAAAGPHMETWLTQDVPAWTARTFRVRTDRSSWSAIGLSAGGWCAAMAAMLHPRLYGSAIVLGGYFAPKFGRYYHPVTRGSPMQHRLNLVALARRSPPPVALWIETSHADHTSFASTAALLRATRPPLSVNAVVLKHAGHRLGLWRQLLPHTLQWLGANIAGFSPGPPDLATAAPTARGR
jgi:enterochelin esterase-like enzyme